MGKKWTKTVSKSVWGMPPIRYLQEFNVISIESVTVLAGAYKAFWIEFTRKSRPDTSSKFGHPKSILSYPNYIKYHIWYSPEVKNIIKYCYVGQEGGWKNIERNYELVAYELALAKNLEKGNEKKGQATFDASFFRNGKKWQGVYKDKKRGQADFCASHERAAAIYITFLLNCCSRTYFSSLTIDSVLIKDSR